MKFVIKFFFWIIIIFPTLILSQEVLISDGGTVNTCSGTFYDSGGSSGVYGANEDYTITICPENNAQVVELDFQSFTTQPVQNGNGDGLIIYNGNSVSAEEFGMFSGTSASSSPGFIVADNPSGCLTIQFFSNGAAQASGWEATISCFEPCQEVTSSISSTPQVNVDGSIEVDLDESIDFFGIGEFSNGNDTNATYEWNFDDGTTGIGENVQHSFSNAGLYNVTLIITDYNDCTSNTAEVQVIVGATTPGNPYVSAGEDFSIICETSAQLSADFLEIGETDTYEVTEIAFVPPFPFNGLSNSVNTNIDDAWDSPQALPFDFCFFGNFYASRNTWAPNAASRMAGMAKSTLARDLANPSRRTNPCRPGNVPSGPTGRLGKVGRMRNSTHRKCQLHASDSRAPPIVRIEGRDNAASAIYKTRTRFPPRLRGAYGNS